MKYRKRLITSILLIAFLGQALAASALPCTMMENSPPPVTLTAQGMDHSMHHGEQGQHGEQATDHTCCSGSGTCSMLNCLSVVALPTAAYVNSPASPEGPTFTSVLATPNHPPEILYRPPISA